MTLTMRHWSRRRRVVSLVAAGGIAATLLVVSLREVEWSRVTEVVGRADWALLLLSGVLVSTTLLLRAARWQLLLGVAGSVRMAAVFRAMAAGTLANTIFPARAGDIIRILLVSADTGLPSTFVLSTAFAERTTDLAAVVVIASAAVFLVPGSSAGLSTLVAISTATVMALGIGLGPRFEPVIQRTIQKLPVRDVIRLFLASAIEHGMAGLRTLHSLRRFSGFAFLTAVIWSVDAMTTVIGGAALGIEIPWPAAFLLLAYLALGAILPSTPAQVGIYQFAAIAALMPFGVARSDAIAYILVAQALFLLVVGLWGTPALLSSGLRQARSNADRSNS
jgi:uncharacterized protein (TIRG00374 family)